MTHQKPDPTAGQTESLDEGAIRGMVGYNLKRAYMAIHPAAQAGVEEVGLRIPSFSCLSVIVQNPGIAPSVLAERLKMERSNVVVVVDELESLDLISRAQSKTDRRRIALTATVRGRRLHDKAVAAIHRQEETLLRHFDAAERAKLVELLQKIEAAATD